MVVMHFMGAPEASVADTMRMRREGSPQAPGASTRCASQRASLGGGSFGRGRSCGSTAWYASPSSSSGGSSSVPPSPSSSAASSAPSLDSLLPRCLPGALACLIIQVHVATRWFAELQRRAVRLHLRDVSEHCQVRARLTARCETGLVTSARTCPCHAIQLPQCVTIMACNKWQGAPEAAGRHLPGHIHVRSLARAAAAADAGSCGNLLGRSCTHSTWEQKDGTQTFDKINHNAHYNIMELSKH